MNRILLILTLVALALGGCTSGENGNLYVCSVVKQAMGESTMTTSAEGTIDADTAVGQDANAGKPE